MAWDDDVAAPLSAVIVWEGLDDRPLVDWERKHSCASSLLDKPTDNTRGDGWSGGPLRKKVHKPTIATVPPVTLRPLVPPR